MQVTTICISRAILKMLEFMVLNGFGASRSEIVRSILSESLPVKLKEWRESLNDVGVEVNEGDELIKIPRDDGRITTWKVIGKA